MSNKIPKISDNFDQVISAQSAYQITSILEGVVKRGTGKLLRDLNLDIAGKTAGNTFIEDRLAKVHADVEMGKKVAFSIQRHTHDIFPPHVLKMIQVGEDAGAMDDMLSEIGDMTDAEVQDRVLKLTASLEPIITVVMGVMILILALAIFLPIWDMYEALSKS